MADKLVASLFKDLSIAFSNTLFVTITFSKEGEILNALSLSSPRDNDKLENLSAKIVSIQTKNLEELKSLTINQVEDTRKAFPDMAQVADDVSCTKYALIPVRDKDNIFGFVWLGEVDTGTLSQSALIPYTSIVSLASTALSQELKFNITKETLEETKRRTQREIMISRISNRVSETLDLDTVLKTSVTELQTVLDLEEAEVQLFAVNEEDQVDE